MEKVYGKAVSGGQVMGKIMLLRRKKINEEDDVRSSEEEIEREALRIIKEDGVGAFLP